MLHSYEENEADWKCHLPLVLFAYQTSVHSSTGIEPCVNVWMTTTHCKHLKFRPSQLMIVFNYLFLEKKFSEHLFSNRKMVPITKRVSSFLVFFLYAH